MNLYQNPVARIVDNFLGTFAPSRQVENMKHRAQIARMSAGSRQGADYGSRYRSAIQRVRVLSPNTAQNQMDRIEYYVQARYLLESFDPLRTVALRFAEYVVGTLDYEPQTGDEKVDAAYDEYLRHWFATCDATGRQSYRHMSQQAVIGALVDGDMFDLYLNASSGLKIAHIEADRIGSPWATAVSEFYAGGIHHDGIQPTGVRLFDRTPYGSYTNPRDIYGPPGFPVTHFFKSLRADSWRDTSHFKSVVDMARDLQLTIEAENLAVQFASKRAGAIEIDPALDDGGDNMETDDATGDDGTPIIQQVIEPALFMRLRPGEKMHEVEVNRPTDGWLGLMELMLKKFANSQGLPASFCYDLASGTGPEVRLKSKQAERVFQDWQDHLKCKRLDRHKNMALMRGIADGDIPGSYSFDKGTWRFGSHPSIDAGRESAADLAENARGAKPLADIYGQGGRRVREGLRQCAREASWKKQFAKEFDVTVPEFSIMTPNGPTAAPAEDAPPAKGDE